MMIPKTNKGRLLFAYGYCGMHILAVAIYLNSTGNEAWSGIFNIVCIVMFFPLWVLTALMGRLIWGSLNIFEANYVFGVFIDFAILSIISIHILIAIFIMIKRKIANNLTCPH